MQTRPDPATVLEAVAAFLQRELAPEVPDKALAFRTLVAANVTAVLAAEARAEDALASAELGRIEGLLGAEAAKGARAATDSLGRRRALGELDGALGRALATGALGRAVGGPLWQHVRATLDERLAVTSPRFDRRNDCETAPAPGAKGPR